MVAGWKLKEQREEGGAGGGK